MKSILLPGLALLLSLTSTTFAQENQELGRMWTFENPPLAYLEKEYGFTPDQEWLDSLRLGSLRLGDKGIPSDVGSASFVSPKGLIMTNTRCVLRAVAETLDADRPARRRDPLGIIKTGFVAAAPEQEIRLRSDDNEWLTAAQLVKISNVTDKVNEKMILDAARKADPELVPQIVSLYQGAVVQLYQYKVYKDVRLVVLPHVQTAHFGGDPDNFTYPRYSLDFAFLRAYEDGKPANTTKHYFKWKSGGATKDELVFVSGNPGTTNRLYTLAQLELERDIRIPMEVERLTNWWRFRTDGPEFDPENPSQAWASARPALLGLENGLKAARGNLQGLEEARLMAQKTVAEKAFKDCVMADEKLAKRHGDLWDRIAGVVEQRRLHEPRARFHTADAAPLLGLAVAVVRSCDPAETEEYREQARKTVESRAGALHSPNGGWTGSCVDHVVRARTWLPEDDPYFSIVLGGKSAEGWPSRVPEYLDVMEGEQAQRSPNWLGYPEPREDLVKAGWKAIQKSHDPAIVAARELVPLMRKHEKLGDELDAKEEALRAEMGHALLACYGTNVSPDGTMTPRFTDGVVRGFPENGTIAPYRTTFHGLHTRNAEFDNEYPFNLPKLWLDRKDKIDMTKPVNFASTNDITRGNSGSVVVNRSLEVVGVVVDGNIESLHNDFVFKDDVPRAVSVHVDGIMEALVKIYDAHRVAEELTGKRAGGR